MYVCGILARTHAPIGAETLGTTRYNTYGLSKFLLYVITDSMLFGSLLLFIDLCIGRESLSIATVEEGLKFT